METVLPLCKILLEREQGDLLTAQSGIGRRLKSGCGVYAANAAAVYHDRGILPYRRVALMFQRQIFVRAGLERVR